jgi:hypothetical protein
LASFGATTACPKLKHNNGKSRIAGSLRGTFILSPFEKAAKKRFNKPALPS